MLARQDPRAVLAGRSRRRHARRLRACRPCHRRPGLVGGGAPSKPRELLFGVVIDEPGWHVVVTTAKRGGDRADRTPEEPLAIVIAVPAGQLARSARRRVPTGRLESGGHAPRCFGICASGHGSAVDPRSARLATNEAVFRAGNEAIDHNWERKDATTRQYLCECGAETCFERVTM